MFLINKKDESLHRVLQTLHPQSAGSRGQYHETGRMGVITEGMGVPTCELVPEGRTGTRSRGSNS